MRRNGTVLFLVSLGVVLSVSLKTESHGVYCICAKPVARRERQHIV